ncbi:MAG: glycosyltransferase [Bdellovibrionia bacterium]
MKFLKSVFVLLLFTLLPTDFFLTDAFAAKKLLILYSTGGHATAARSIEKLVETHLPDFEVVRHDFALELTGFPKWFYLEGFNLMSRYLNWVNKYAIRSEWKAADRTPSLVSERSMARFNQPDKILEYIEQIHPDIIIATHFSMAQTLAVLREEGHLKDIPIAWTHLDMVSNIFYKQIGSELDMSFVPTEAMQMEWAELMDPQKVIATGIPIMPDMLERSERHHEEDAISFGLDPEVPIVLLMGGSLGLMNYSEIIKNVSKSFKRVNNSPVQFLAICGKNEKARKNLKRWSKTSRFPENARLEATGFLNASQLIKSESASNLIISKAGGLTTFELLTAELPLIMTQGVGFNEQFNAKFLEEEGAAMYVTEDSRLGDAAFDLLKDTEKLTLMVENQQRMKSHFKLEKIVEWVKNPGLAHTGFPSERILERLIQHRPVNSI